MDGSRTTAVSGAIAEPTVRLTAVPTGTDAACGCTTIGGGVAVGPAAEVATGTGEGVGEGGEV